MQFACDIAFVLGQDEGYTVKYSPPLEGRRSAVFDRISRAQLFQSSIIIMDIVTYRLNQPWGQCSENHLK